MQPLFTIGMPVCNAMPHLPEAVESALRQTYPHFELLIVNDGSRDGSLEYLRSLQDSRVRIISQDNRGLTATLNRLLEEAHAPWLARLDADDVACPERLAVAAAAIERQPAAGMFYSRAAHCGHHPTIAAARSTEGSPAELRELTCAGYLLSIVHSSVVLNVARARALGGYRFDLHIEDLDLWWRMALRHGIVFIPRVTVHYRLSHGGVCLSPPAKSLRQHPVRAIPVALALVGLGSTALRGRDQRAQRSGGPQAARVPGADVAGRGSAGRATISPRGMASGESSGVFAHPFSTPRRVSISPGAEWFTLGKIRSASAAWSGDCGERWRPRKQPLNRRDFLCVVGAGAGERTGCRRGRCHLMPTSNRRRRGMRWHAPSMRLRAASPDV